jgi:hypothetical protein
VAGPLDAAELLDVDVQQFPRSFALVADDRLGRREVAQLGQASTGQYPADGAARNAQCLRDARLRQAPAAQLDDGQRFARRDRTRAARRREGGPPDRLT